MSIVALFCVLLSQIVVHNVVQFCVLPIFGIFKLHLCFCRCSPLLMSISMYLQLYLHLYPHMHRHIHAQKNTQTPEHERCAEKTRGNNTNTDGAADWSKFKAAQPTLLLADTMLRQRMCWLNEPFLIVDTNNYRVQVYPANSPGSSCTTVVGIDCWEGSGSAQLSFRHSATVDALGNYVIVDTGNSRVQVCATSPSLTCTTVATDRNGYEIAVATSGDYIVATIGF